MLIFIVMALALSLIALSTGVLLLVWALRSKEVGSTIATITGAIISIMALVLVLYLGVNVGKAMTESSAPPPPRMQPQMQAPGQHPGQPPMPQAKKPS